MLNKWTITMRMTPTAIRGLVAIVSTAVKVRTHPMPEVTAATSGRGLRATRRSLSVEKCSLRGDRAQEETGVLQVKGEDLRMKFLKGGEGA